MVIVLKCDDDQYQLSTIESTLRFPAKDLPAREKDYSQKELFENFSSIKLNLTGPIS